MKDPNIIDEGTTSYIKKTDNKKFVQKVLKNNSQIYQDLLKMEYENYQYFYKNNKNLRKYIIKIKDYNPTNLCFTMSNLLELNYINLLKYIHNYQNLDEKYKLKICHQLIDFLKELHFNTKYTHSDIKPNNIFVKKTDFNIKFIDFGFSRQYDPNTLYNSLGTILFSCPDMIIGIVLKKKLLGSYFYLNDWWGLGLTLIFILHHNEYLKYKKYMTKLIAEFKEKKDNHKMNIHKSIEKYKNKFHSLLFERFKINFFN
jgi:serine/threonine protein kinase